MRDIFDRASGRPDLQHSIERLGLQDEDWFLLEQRINLHLTLQEIADIEGVTRERIRQRQLRRTRDLMQRASMVAHVFDTLEYVDQYDANTEHCESEISSQFITDLAAATDWYLKQLIRLGWTGLSSCNAYRLLLAFRVLANEQPTLVATRWPAFSLASCLIRPRITSPPNVQAYTEEQERLNRYLTYRELSQLVLADAQEPLHWHDIADCAEMMNRRKSFSPTALYNAINSAPEIFVRVGSGTYGLVEWGLNYAESYGDIFAEAMLCESRTMSVNELSYRAQQEREAKQTSIQMTLDLNVRFYRAESGTYGLRAWLPPRHLQTLRTPIFLVEVTDSYTRVDRLRNKGYDVEAIVERDRTLMQERRVCAGDIRS